MAALGMLVNKDLTACAVRGYTVHQQSQPDSSGSCSAGMQGKYVRLYHYQQDRVAHLLVLLTLPVNVCASKGRERKNTQSTL